MALAYLKYEGCDRQQCLFTADIGTNNLYTYRIGTGKLRLRGLPAVDGPAFESALQQPDIANPMDTRFSFTVDAGRFAGDHRFIQVCSYKDAERRSPAFSEVVEVVSVLSPGWALQARSFSTPQQKTQQMYQQACRSVPFQYRAAPVSRALFWETLLAKAIELAPALLQAIETKAAGNGQGTGKDAGPPMLRLLMEVLEALRQQGAPAAGAAAPVATASSVNGAGRRRFSTLSSLSLAHGQRAPGSNLQRPYSHGKVVDGGVISGPLLASVAAPLLSSLLGPLLQQAPQLLQTVLDSPLKLINAINERKLARQELEQGYLERLLAQVNQRHLMEQLVGSGVVQPSGLGVGMSFTPSSRYQVSLGLEGPVNVAGKPRFVFSGQSEVRLKLNITENGAATPQLIPRAIVRFTLKQGTTAQVLFEKQFKFREMRVGAALELVFAAGEWKDLPRNTDLLAGVTFLWRSPEGSRNLGVYDNHFLLLTDGYLLGTVGEAVSGEVPLNDVVLHRPFWHKVWEGGGNKRRWELELDAKYLCVYRYDADTNGRMETKMQTADEGQQDGDGRLRLTGKMKTGLEVSPVALNQLLPQLGPYPQLTEGQLAALRTDDLEPVMNQEANVRIAFKGRRDERGVLWVYPEMKVRTLVLGKVTQTNDSGQVVAVADEPVFFPMISSLHFIGAKTE